MTTDPNCPKCHSENSYHDGSLWVCPDCAHEWTPAAEVATAPADVFVVKDAYGTILQDGDSVSVIKDLKINGSSSVVKVGTKAKNIQLLESADGHNIGCKLEGIGRMNLKSEFVKKV